MKLRPYQQAAVDSVYNHLRTRADNPCIVIPTGGGKTPVISTICSDVRNRWQGRVLVLAHVKELLEQAANTLKQMDHTMNVGVYSAGLKSRDVINDIIVAGIQSVYKKACDLGPFDLIIIDEAHLIPPSGEGMYRTFIEEMTVINPKVRILGLTATPYRMKLGTICDPMSILNHTCYEVGVNTLIRQGFLSPLLSKASAKAVDTSDLHLRGGEFIPAEVAELVDNKSVVNQACQDIIKRTVDRKSVLIFAASVEHAQHVAGTLNMLGEVSDIITGETLDFNRAQSIADFKSGKLKFLVNVNVLTTGFDAPNVDCIILLRPTNSPGLYYQMVGRGFRICEGKTDCLILDYAGNIIRHGPVDMVDIAKPKTRGGGGPGVKACPDCESVWPNSSAVCNDCGYVFFDPKAKQHAAEAAAAAILSAQEKPEPHVIHRVHYGCHVKRNSDPGAPRTLRVEYQINMLDSRKEWVCLEHKGFARKKAVAWWERRSDMPCPDNVDDAIRLIECHGIGEPTQIETKMNRKTKFEEIVSTNATRKKAVNFTNRQPGEDEQEINQANESGYESWKDIEDDEIPF